MRNYNANSSSSLTSAVVTAYDIGLFPNNSIARISLIYIFLIILSVLINPCLRAQTVEEQIELPDVIIFGETDKLIDTISLEERLRPYWNLSTLEAFRYKPFLTPEQVKVHHKSSKDDNGYLSLHGGNELFLNLRGRLHSLRNKWLAFFTELKYDEIIEDRLSRSFRICWVPEYQRSFLALEFFYSNYTETEKEHGMLIGDPSELYDLEITGLSFSLTQKDSARLFLPYRDFFLKAAYTTYEQSSLPLSNVKEKADDVDLQTRITLPIDDFEVAFPLEFVLLKNNTLGFNAAIRKDNLSFLDHLALHVVADSYYALPALGFHSKLEMSRFIRFIISNDPQIDTRTRFNLLTENPDQFLAVNKRLVKTPLNGSVVFENDRFIPLSLSYNIRWHKDYLFYNDSNTQYFFTQNMIDLLEQQISFSFSYSYHHLQFRNNFDYYLYKETTGSSGNLTAKRDEIPFLPEWNNITTLGWFADSLTLRTDLKYIFGRKNLTGNDMPDVALLSFSGRKRILKSLSAELSVQNILQEPYRKFELSEPLIVNPDTICNQIPEEPLQFRAGLIWRF
jgi:hypothetical protein